MIGVGAGAGIIRPGGNLKALPITDGLISWWDFLAGFNTLTLTDIFSGNNGTITNATAGQFWANGPGEGIFDEIDDHVVISGNPSGLQLTGDLSVEAWCKLNDVTGTKGICGKSDNSTDKAFQFRIDNDEPTFVISDDGSTDYTRKTVAADLTTSVWVQLVVTYDASAADATFYCNASEETDNGGALVSSINNSAENFQVGRGHSSGRYYGGSLGTLRLYNKVLTSAEVLHNFNVDRGRFGI